MVVDTLNKYILTENNPFVIDLDNSQDSWIVEKNTKKSYLDCFSQFASQPLGWNHPKVLAQKERLTKSALHKVANSDMYTEDYAKFVETFAKFTPDFKHYFFVSGGALAVENALKAAFDWKAQLLELPVTQTNKLDVIHLTEAFHGRSGYTLSLTNNPTSDLKTRWFPKFNWSRIVNPKLYHPVKLNNVKKLEELSLDAARTSLKKGNVAAILLEPIQGEGGDNYFRKEYFVELRKLADEYDAMLIFDEVQTGMGITGKTWAYEHFGVVPDMLCFGKKTQVCGFCATDRIDSVKENVFVKHYRINSTWGGNIVDMTRSTIYMEIIEEDNLIKNARDVGNHLLTELSKLNLENLRGRGLMIAFDLENKEKRDECLSLLTQRMLALPCGNKSIRLRPHLTFTHVDANTAVELIGDTIKS